jgi:2-succinyl-5-enolpyruvyl-6-hydroxy-3-cyclohexene-1-carboxylate synthase
MDTASLNLHWARCLIGSMVDAGLRLAVISPGSRSTPLTLALAEHPGLRTVVHFDERCAAFLALGYARATGRPALLVCTSGSAGAHYLPAFIEASQAGIPMLAITADRPPELREIGAWQTIDQHRLFGGFVRWFCELSPPAEGDFMLRYARDVAGRAFETACGPIPGPVQLNQPFREPLVPREIPPMANPRSLLPARPESSPRPARFASPEQIAALAARIAACPRGLILAGQLGPCELLAALVDGPDATSGAALAPGAAYREALCQVARYSGYPILAEPAGGLRFGAAERELIITGHDAFLRDPEWRQAQAPQLILRFGASFAWKQVAEYLAEHPSAQQVIVDPFDRRDDPTRSGAQRLAVDPLPFARALAVALSESAGRAAEATTAEISTAEPSPEEDPEPAAWPDHLASRHANAPNRRAQDRLSQNQRWRGTWLQARDLAGRRVDALTGSDAARNTVAWVYPTLLDFLPADSLLWLANSMAVRDLDSFSGASPKRIEVLVNRGAAGIDGTLSSALGAALGSGKPCTLVTGDLAFLHDLNGLAAQGVEDADLQVIVLDDGGGGIFAHLPIAEAAPERFERYFRTPPRADLRAACALYDIPYFRAEDAPGLRAALEAGAGLGGRRVIVVPVDLDANTRMHRELWRAIAKDLRKLSPQGPIQE